MASFIYLYFRGMRPNRSRERAEERHPYGRAGQPGPDAGRRNGTGHVTDPGSGAAVLHVDRRSPDLDLRVSVVAWNPGAIEDA